MALKRSIQLRSSQKEDTTMVQGRCNFDTLVEFNPRLTSKLDTELAIFENCNFKSSLVKIQLDKNLSDKKEKLWSL